MDLRTHGLFTQRRQSGRSDNADLHWRCFQSCARCALAVGREGPGPRPLPGREPHPSPYRGRGGRCPSCQPPMGLRPASHWGSSLALGSFHQWDSSLPAPRGETIPGVSSGRRRRGPPRGGTARTAAGRLLPSGPPGTGQSQPSLPCWPQPSPDPGRRICRGESSDLGG